MNKKLYILFLWFISINCIGQNSNIIFEQVALNYFADSILDKKDPFLNCKAHFNGQVDSNITTIRYSLIMQFPEDNELKEEYLKVEKANKYFWKNNKKPTFTLDIGTSIENKTKKKYKKNSKIVRLKVFQNKAVGDKNYVWFRVFTGTGNEGYDLHFIIDKSGQVLNYVSSSFIF